MTLFGKAKSRELSKIVNLHSVSGARRSGRELLIKFNAAKTDQGKLHVLRATVEAANRAEVISNNKLVSVPVRRRENEIEGAYRRVASVMSSKYAKHVKR